MERRRELREIGGGDEPRETMDSEKQSEGFKGVGGWRLGEPGGGYWRGHGLNGALGVVQKQ